MPNGNDDPVSIYEPKAPEWLPIAHTTADLGYIGYDPPRPGQDEDILTANNIKNGYSVPPAVPAEGFSAQEALKPRLQDVSTLKDLQDLMNQVLARRSNSVGAVSASTFRIPNRVTQNESKRQQWFADLADPQVPLLKLGKSVPHGTKGADLLDLLNNHNVAIPRAIWLLRALGGNETSALKSKPTYNPTQYSVDQAIVITNYLSKQLSCIGLPSAPRALNIKQTFKGILSDPDSRKGWVSKFSYSLDLVRTLYAEGLIDNRTYLCWLTQAMTTCNLAQAGFVAHIAEEYLDGILVTRALARPFVEACLARLVEITSSSVRDGLENMNVLLQTMLQRTALVIPGAFVSPHLWTRYSGIVEETMTSVVDVPTSLQERFTYVLANIALRNSSLLFLNLPPRQLASVGSAVSDVQLLNSISVETDMDRLAFFADSSEAGQSNDFAGKLDTLLTWSATRLQYGDHRPYAAVAILAHWLEQAEERATRRDTADSPRRTLQDNLFDWLDVSPAAVDPENLEAVALMFGELVKRELFSYAEYIQRLIARGESGLSFTEENGSRHRNFLRWIPLHRSTPAMISQRKVTLHGVRARETPEDTNERDMRKEIRAVLAEVFGGDPPPTPISMAAVMATCPVLRSSPRYECVKTIRQWLLPILSKYTSRRAADTTAPINHILRTYGLSICMMEHLQCYGSILDLTLTVLEHTTTSDLLNAVVEALRRYMDMWVAMRVTRRIVDALYAAHQYWRNRGIQNRFLLTLLIDMDHNAHLEPAAREQVTADIAVLVRALAPTDNVTEVVVPGVLPEILLLAGDPAPEAPSILANSLWYKYRMASDWAWKVWDNTIASLRQIPAIMSSEAERRVCALRYVTFLQHVDQHLPAGFDDQVLQWFLGPGKKELTGLSREVWDVLTVVLVALSVHGALTTTGILQGVVYPAWQTAARVSDPEEGENLAVTAQAIGGLVQWLMLSEEASGSGIPPVDLIQLRRIQARRQEVHRDPHFALLVANIPVLVFMERNRCLPHDIRTMATSLRHRISKARDFRQGVYRNLDAVQTAFAQTLDSDSIAEDLHEPLVNALRLVLNDTDTNDVDADGSDLRDIASLLTPWKICATRIALQFTLGQWAEELRDPARECTAAKKLQDFTGQFFHLRMTSDQADFVAGLAQGTSAAVVGKFINTGLSCIAEILSDKFIPLDGCPESENVMWAGEILRLLIYLLEAVRTKTATLPGLEPEVQNALIPALCGRLEACEAFFSGQDPSLSIEEVKRSYTPRIIFLARLLQFDLAFPGTWTASNKECIPRLSASLFNLLLVHGGEPYQDLVAFPLLLDTFYYLLDDIPGDVPGQNADPLAHYPKINMSELPPTMPSEFRAQIRSLLPYVDPNQAVANLSKDGTPVQHHPWEWLEYLGEPSPSETQGSQTGPKTRHAVANSTSLPLELFGTVQSGDGIFKAGTPAAAGADAPRRMFEDGLSAESVFRRDWRETRLELGPFPFARPRGEEQDEVGALPAFPRRKGDSRRASPASSVRSHGSASSMRPSPAQATGTSSRRSGSSTTDSTTRSRAGAKRKAGNASNADDDSDIEMLDGPPPGSAASSSKKPKTKQAPKPRAKKR